MRRAGIDEGDKGRQKNRRVRLEKAKLRQEEKK